MTETTGGRAGWVGLAAVVAVALGLRLFELGSVPGVFFHDECDNAGNVIQILRGKGPGIYELDWKPQPALAVRLIAWSVEGLGPSLFAIRLPSALFGVATLVPFFLVARRVASPGAALAGAALLAANPVHLHFSRSGWENVQIGFYTLLVLEALLRARERRGAASAVTAGVASALAAMTYFAGRLVTAVVAVFGLLELAVRRDRPTLRFYAIAAAVWVVCLAPLAPTLHERWDHFQLRTRTVLVEPEPGPYGFARAVWKNTSRSVGSLYDGSALTSARYSPAGEPLLPPFVLALFAVGAAVVWRRPWTAALWWLALAIPFAATQMITHGAPSVSRGIGMIPVAHLFVAAGADACLRVARRLGARAGERIVAVVLALAVGASVVQGVATYFDYARDPQTLAALEPAVRLDEFGEWWRMQNRRVAASQGILNVYEWRKLRESSRKPSPPPEAPDP